MGQIFTQLQKNLTHIQLYFSGSSWRSSIPNSPPQRLLFMTCLSDHHFSGRFGRPGIAINLISTQKDAQCLDAISSRMYRHHFDSLTNVLPPFLLFSQFVGFRSFINRKLVFFCNSGFIPRPSTFWHWSWNRCRWLLSHMSPIHKSSCCQSPYHQPIGSRPYSHLIPV